MIYRIEFSKDAQKVIKKQRDFAKALGKTETEVSRWLSGTHNLTLATIAKMATVLGDDIITTTQSNRP